MHLALGDEGSWLARIRFDHRGLWLQVNHGVAGVHLNGRPIVRLAMLRPGDGIYLEGSELLLQASATPMTPMPPLLTSDTHSPELLLRGVGGLYHGQAVSLQHGLLVGRDPEADIRLDDPTAPLRHATVELHEGRVWLRELGNDDTSLINGRPIREGWVLPGDQICFAGRHRFVLEAPSQPANSWMPQEVTEQAPAVEEPEVVARVSTVARWPWLLLSALLLAALLSALLWFGAR